MKSQSAAKFYNKTDQKLIGKTFNMIHVLKFSHKENRRRYYLIKCLRCEKESTMRSDRFTKTQKLNTCKYCRQDYAISKNQERASLDSVINALYTHVKKGSKSKNRNYEFLLSKEQFKYIISQNCIYCGQPPIESMNAKRYNKTNIPFKHNGIDRFDNKQGYTIENSVPCCKICNHMKKDMNYKDFINHIEKIYSYKKGSTTSQK